MRRILLSVIALLVLLPVFASAANYYVDKNSLGGTCDDYNSPVGSLTQPFCTIGKANSVVQAGDTVYIRQGSYSENAFVEPMYSTIRPANSGTPNNYITYTNYNGEEAIITGNSYGADLTNRQYIKIDGLKFIRTNYYWVNMQISSNYNIIQNCFFNESGAAWAGIWLGNDPDDPGQANYNRIINNTLIGNCHPEDLIYLLPNASYNLIEGNRLFNGPHVAIELQAFGTSTTSRIEYNVIRNNYVQNLWHTGINVYTNSNHNLVEGNIIADSGENHLNNTCGSERDRTNPRWVHGGVQSGASDCIYRRNVLINNGMSTIESWDANTISNDNRWYHNTFNQNYRGIHLTVDEHEINRNVIKNNLFYNNRDYEIECRTAGSNFTPRENYFVNNNVLGAPIRYYPRGDDLDYLQTTYPQLWYDNTALNPLFIDEANRNLSLQQGSPMIDAGAFLTKTMSTGSGSQIPVEDARYFMDGWGVIEGDLIQLEGQSITAKVVSVDYNNHIITVDKSLSWVAGQGVSLPYSGSAPDIGAYESSGSIPPTCAAADINCDSKIDVSDLSLVARDFGKTAGYNSKCDTNNDKIIDIFDVVYVASRFT